MLLQIRLCCHCKADFGKERSTVGAPHILQRSVRCAVRPPCGVRYRSRDRPSASEYRRPLYGAAACAEWQQAGDGIKLLRKTAPGLKEAALRAEFKEAMTTGMTNAQKNMPKNHEEIRAVLSTLKLLCFSEVHDNILMWAHYAKDHTGVVIEFSVLEDLDSAWGAAKPVRYRKEMPYLVNEEKLVRLLSGEGT